MRVLASAGLLLPALALGQSVPGSIGHCLGTQEVELADLVNAYRQSHGLAPVPVSRSLSTVGQWHAWDLETQQPAVGACNLHSWSNAQPSLWTPVCYLSDHSQAMGMWNKPSQITGNVYNSFGYELAAASGSGISPGLALSLWQGSPGHSPVILNQGSWANRTWRAMGVGLAGGHALLWFGELSDPLGSMPACAGDLIFHAGFQF